MMVYSRWLTDTLAPLLRLRLSLVLPIAVALLCLLSAARASQRAAWPAIATGAHVPQQLHGDGAGCNPGQGRSKR